MSGTFTSKQPYEAYAISFDFTAVLGVETIASATITAVDQIDLTDVSLIVLDITKQAMTGTVVYGWVRAGTSGHSYLITCRIVGSAGSLYELEGVLPVLETPSAGTGTGGPGPVVPPAVEPVSLQDMKEHLRLSSGAFTNNLSPVQSIAPGSHAIANNYTTHVGVYADVLGLQGIVVLDSGTNGATGGATGTVDVKIQESDDHVTWTDWTGGAFSQVTTATDNAIYKIAYTGTKQYIRPVAKVLLAACEFGVEILKYSSDATEDALLAGCITTAREEAEAETWRALITQTWDIFLDIWPDKNFINLPYGNLQSVVSLVYTDSDGVTTTMMLGIDYLVDTRHEPGRIVLPYGKSWPSFTPYPVNPIAVRFICGYGDAATNVPESLRTGIKMRAADLYSERGERIIGSVNVTENKIPENYFRRYKLWEF